MTWSTFPTDIISYDNDAVMNYIQEFANFTQVPRTSYDTDKMTEYLKVWAAARGIDCVADEVGNVVMNLPATEGCEDAPVVIFQGHIDMVPDTDEGVVHDWANDPLDLIWTSNTLKADGTSLGAGQRHWRCLHADLHGLCRRADAWSPALYLHR